MYGKRIQFHTLVETCRDALTELYAHELIDHLVQNENIAINDARSIVFAAGKKEKELQ